MTTQIRFENYDNSKLEAAILAAIADSDYNLTVNPNRFEDENGNLMLAVWDDSLVEADPDLTDSEDVAAIMIEDVQFRTYVFEDPASGEYILEANV